MKLKFVGLLLIVVFGVLASQSADLADFDLLSGYMAEKVFTPLLQAPNHVAISHSGIIVVTD